MMVSADCTDERWTEAALNWVDFDLNVSSELSEERSDANSEEFMECENEEPCITIAIGHDPDEEVDAEEMESDDEEQEEDKDLASCNRSCVNIIQNTTECH